MDIRLSGAIPFCQTATVPGSAHDDNRLKLDGTATVIGPVSLSFRRINELAFDVVGALDIPDHNLGEVRRFVFLARRAEPD